VYIYIYIYIYIYEEVGNGIEATSFLINKEIQLKYGGSKLLHYETNKESR
jgi:hypothetical protein